MSGSSPDADAVTASGGTSAGSTPSRAAISSRRWLIVSSRSWLNPLLLEPPEVVVSPGPSGPDEEAEGRVWKYGSAAGSAGTGSTPMSDDPTGVPLAS